MGNALDLLRALEPAVRPVGAPARPVAAKLPIEQQSFDQLLTQAAEMETYESAAAVDAQEMGELGNGEAVTTDQLPQSGMAKPVNNSQDLMRQLGAIGNIANPAVRSVLTL